MAPRTAAQRSDAARRAWITRHHNLAAGTAPARARAARVRKQRHCACGCGTVVATRHRYVHGHRPQRSFACRCGCGIQLPGRRPRYAKGHRPKGVRSPFKRQPKPAVVLLQSLALTEKAVGLKLGEDGAITDEQRAKWNRYQKLKQTAIGGLKTADVAMQNEGKVALRMAVVHLLDLVKEIF